jgi:NADPH-dependent curcumin reductase CurA
MPNNRKIILTAYPKGMVKPSDFALIEDSLPILREDEILVRTLYITVDPYMRGRMNEHALYGTAFKLNWPISGGVVGKVVESKNSKFKVDDIVHGFMDWADYSVVNAKEVQKVNPHLAPISTALGVLGMPGMTAYFGLLDIAQPEAGETIVISGAAGAVGTIVGQIAKIKGCHVVGIAGSSKKTDYLLNELHFDAAVNYKVPSFTTDLKKSCPKGVDVYFDNVGGVITDEVLNLLNKNARIPICGQISMYNSEKVDIGIRPFSTLLIKTATAKGFMVSDYLNRFSEGILQMAQWIKEGKIIYNENIIEGLENTPEAFIGLFKGENIGKQLVKVSSS